jgi:DNA-3-methyladenine glycosylase
VGRGRRRLTLDLIARDFLDRPADEVAPALLGCVLEHETGEGLVAVELTEVEAYAGETDPASHAYRGMTGRNAVMFGPAGHAYVYFTYGMHFCVNVVCMPQGIARAVLLRAGRVVAGEALARRRRAPRRADAGGPGGLSVRELARGPARLCQALAIDRAQNGADLCSPASELRLRPADTIDQAAVPGKPGVAGEATAITAGPRVGVSAGADTPWRFWLTGDPSVSAYRPHKKRVGLTPVTARTGTKPLAEVLPSAVRHASHTGPKTVWAG